MQEQPETIDELKTPLPTGTILGYDGDHRSAIEEHEGSEMIITGHFPGRGTHGEYTYKILRDDGGELANDSVLFVHDYILREKYPWYLKEYGDDDD